MTCGRFWLFTPALWSAAVALSAGCGNGVLPCTDCPPLEGRYSLEFADGATPAECTTLGVRLPEGPLELQRTGSQLTTTLGGVALQGTLYQTYDFNLLGTQGEASGGSTSLNLSGRYAPGPTDGGAGRLSGTFTGTYTRPSAQGTLRCTLSRPYTATP
jgi:hypothetical protein